MAKALIIGASSQDGSYLAELLLEKGYEVTGTVRRSSSYGHPNIKHLYGKIDLVAADLIDPVSLEGVVGATQPDEVYNLAAMSVPADSWTHPIYTAEVTGIGPARVLEAIRAHAPHARFYQASSREIFGNVQAESANEATKIDANNPYGIAKASAHMLTRCYRESYGLFSCAGVLFNHESPRRGLHFVTRKITAGVACIKNGVTDPPLNEQGRPLISASGKLHMGNLAARRDWGYAKEYVEAMWLMLQQDDPTDYVIGTRVSYSVEDFLRIAFEHVGLDWQEHVVEDEAFHRPTEIRELTGDYAKAKANLGWEPRIAFEDLVTMMVDSDMQIFR